MSRPRMSILGLIAGVVACGVAFAALRSGSDYWLSAFYTLTVALLLWAVLAARYRRGTSRAFWFGFAVFGWGFFLLSTNPWMTQLESFGQGFGANLNRSLLTTRLIYFLVVRVRMGTDDLEEIDRISANTVGIVHLMLVLAVAFLGGFIAVAMKKRARKVAMVDPPRRPNVIPSVVILVGLSFAGLGLLDRPSPAYFPETASGPDDLDSEYLVEWCSNALRSAGESPLNQLARQDREATVYRFLWLPNFDHPLIVRVARTGPGARLQAVALDGRGGFDPSQAAINKSVELSRNQWKELERHLAATPFWEIPARKADHSRTEGDQWIVESVKDGRYHVVDIGGPEAAYITLCRYVVGLTGLKSRRTWVSNPPPSSP